MMPGKEPSVVVGIGSGHCGTTSLRELLSAQSGVAFSQEALPPVPRSEDGGAVICRRLRQRGGGRIVGDVAPYHLYHVSGIVSNGGRVLCLKRSQRETVESYLRVKGEHKWECACRVSGNTWGFGGPRPMLALPQVEAETFAEAMATYWQVYYDLVDEYVKCWPDKVRVFPTDALNTEEGVREILRFVGVEQPVVKTGIRRHASRPNTSLFMS